MLITLSLIISYLLGSFPSGYLAGRYFANIDLRDKGAGSTGATNVLRHVGKIPAVFVFLIDVGKGIAAGKNKELSRIICGIIDIEYNKIYINKKYNPCSYGKYFHILNDLLIKMRERKTNIRSRGIMIYHLLHNNI